MPASSSAAEDAVREFTEKTGVPVVVIVEDGVDIFGKQTPASAIITIILSIGAVVAGVVLIVRAVKKRNDVKKEADSDLGYDYEDKTR